MQVRDSPTACCRRRCRAFHPVHRDRAIPQAAAPRTDSAATSPEGSLDPGGPGGTHGAGGGSTPSANPEPASILLLGTGLLALLTELRRRSAI